MIAKSVCLRQQIRGLQWTIRFNRSVFPIDPAKRPQDVPLILSPRLHGFVRLWSVRDKYSCVYVSSDTKPFDRVRCICLPYTVSFNIS